MKAELPPVPSLKAVAQRLEDIFPEGVNHRNYCVREVAARTVWVMLYVGATEGADRWIRPSMVTDMTDQQAKLLADADRQKWYERAASSEKRRPANAWFAPNSREQIRDETIRTGFMPNGAVIQRKGVATTSPRPKYALAATFASLFDEALSGSKLVAAIEEWRKANLSRSALARVALIKKGATKGAEAIQVTYPSSHTHSLAPGPSSILSKAVIEDFASRYLVNPAVLWLSESASKVREYDKELAESLGLSIDPKKELPDLILVDVAGSSADFLVVFVEVVATDGPVTETRKAALLTIAKGAGFDESAIAFLTVFLDRSAPAFRKAVADLALGSFTWFMAEPDSLMILRDGKPVALASLRR